jgi:predicted metal-dependent hydrolase
MEQVVFDSIKVDLVKKDIKNIYLSVRPPDGRVKLSVPKRISEKQVRHFLLSKTEWIKKQKQRCLTLETKKKCKFLEGEKHFFLGKTYTLSIKYHFKPPQIKIKDEKYIQVYIKPSCNTAFIEKLVISWYREELEKIVKFFVKKWEPILNVNVKEFRIKRMKTRWGTCNSLAKRIWINLELIKKPSQIIEYIVLHEMVHFFINNHGNDFKELMYKYMPNWKTYKLELNKS